MTQVSHMNEAGMLLQAAELRQRYRQEQGALNFQLPEAKVRVQQAFSIDSSVQVEALSPMQAGGGPSQLLVSEMMILAGQAIAQLGTSRLVAS